MAVWLVVVGVLGAAPAGCTKDTDCKGDRICEAGQCVSPPASSAAPPAALTSPPAMTPATLSPAPPPPPTTLPPPPPPPAAPNPNDYPKVVRRNGVTCIQTLGDDGVVREDCRVQGNEYSGTRRPVASGQDEPMPSSSFAPRVEQPAPRRSPVTADFGIVGGLGIIAAGGGAVVPAALGLQASVEGRVSEVAALGAVFNTTLLLGTGGIAGLVTLAPALRLGGEGHATISLGPTLAFVSSYRGSVTGLMGSMAVYGVVPLVGGFGLHLEFGIAFDQSGAIFRLGSGFGGSVF